MKPGQSILLSRKRERGKWCPTTETENTRRACSQITREGDGVTGLEKGCCVEGFYIDRFEDENIKSAEVNGTIDARGPRGRWNQTASGLEHRQRNESILGRGRKVLDTLFTMTVHNDTSFFSLANSASLAEIKLLSVIAKVTLSVFKIQFIF